MAVACILTATLLRPALAEETIWQTGELRILANDTLAIYIWPPVENLSVECIPSKPIFIKFSTNDLYEGQRVSSIYVTPKSEGTYSFMVTFSFAGAWNATIGVYTSEPKFYETVGTPTITPAGGTSAGSLTILTSSFIILFPKIGISPEGDRSLNHKINVTLQVYNKSSNPLALLGSFKPLSIFLFAATVAGLAYFDIFLIVDSYFKNRIEGVPKTRWALIILLILASFFILYQVRLMILEG